MTDISFSTAPVPAPSVEPSNSPETFEPDQRSAVEGLGSEEPLEGATATQTFLSLIGVDDADGIPDQDQQYLESATQYILGIVKQRGATPTKSTMERALDSVKEEFGLDPQAEPSVILERLGAVVDAWKDLSYIRDVSERRKILMRVARLPDARAIDAALFDEMEKRRVYRG